MARIGELIGGTITTVVEHPIVQVLAIGVFATVATLWLATAWWVLTDLGRRQANPAFAYLAAAGVVVATPLFFPLALAVYLILRPSLTLAEARQQRLAEMALALEEGVERCPDCGLLTDSAWIACPACRARLGHRCVGCDGTMGLDWIACAWCATEVPDAGAIAETELPARLIPVGPGLHVEAASARPGVPVVAALAAAAGTPAHEEAPPTQPAGAPSLPNPEHAGAAAAVGAPSAAFLGRRFAINRHR